MVHRSGFPAPAGPQAVRICSDLANENFVEKVDLAIAGNRTSMVTRALVRADKCWNVANRVVEADLDDWQDEARQDLGETRACCPLFGWARASLRLAQVHRYRPPFQRVRSSALRASAHLGAGALGAISCKNTSPAACSRSIGLVGATQKPLTSRASRS